VNFHGLTYIKARRPAWRMDRGQAAAKSQRVTFRTSSGHQFQGILG
jgi:hypothetical protein